MRQGPAEDESMAVEVPTGSNILMHAGFAEEGEKEQIAATIPQCDGN
jgi:hypothetical protein